MKRPYSLWRHWLYTALYAPVFPFQWAAEKFRERRWGYCADCGRRAGRQRAIDIGGTVFCATCAPEHGMFPGERPA